MGAELDMGVENDGCCTGNIDSYGIHGKKNQDRLLTIRYTCEKIGSVS